MQASMGLAAATSLEQLWKVSAVDSVLSATFH